MIFRATQKVSSKLRIACTAIVDSRPSMVEWYCNLITAGRRQFFLFTHASSLFSFWVPATGSTLNDFGQVFRQHATDTLRDYGFTNADTARVIDDGPDAFAKAADRVRPVIDHPRSISIGKPVVSQCVGRVLAKHLAEVIEGRPGGRHPERKE